MESILIQLMAWCASGIKYEPSLTRITMALPANNVPIHLLTRDGDYADLHSPLSKIFSSNFSFHEVISSHGITYVGIVNMFFLCFGEKSVNMRTNIDTGFIRRARCTYQFAVYYHFRRLIVYHCVIIGLIDDILVLTYWGLSKMVVILQTVF